MTVNEANKKVRESEQTIEAAYNDFKNDIMFMEQKVTETARSEKTLKTLIPWIFPALALLILIISILLCVLSVLAVGIPGIILSIIGMAIGIPVAATCGQNASRNYQSVMRNNMALEQLLNAHKKSQ